jgi:hypothetical protein
MEALFQTLGLRSVWIASSLFEGFAEGAEFLRTQRNASTATMGLLRFRLLTPVRKRALRCDLQKVFGST